MYFIMPDTTKEDESEGSRMIREIQEQRRREESAEANSMIRKIQAQQKLARHLMREAETRTRVKPPPSHRQLTKKKGKVFRGYNAFLSKHLENKQRKEENAEANAMIQQIQAQQKLARHLMREAETRTRVKPPPSRRQLMKKTRGIGKVTRGYNGILTNHLENKQRKVENAEANSMIRKIQAQQKLARHLMRLAETRTRVKPPPSRRQLTKKLLASYQALSNQLNNQLMDEIRYRYRYTQNIKPKANKKHNV